MVEAQPDWIPSRLFTTAGLRGAHEQEVRASAALMPILGAVPTFSRALLKPLGAPGGRIETFTEVILKTVQRHPSARLLASTERGSAPTIQPELRSRRRLAFVWKRIQPREILGV